MGVLTPSTLKSIELEAIDPMLLTWVEEKA